jgi:hypothetical protein
VERPASSILTEIGRPAQHTGRALPVRSSLRKKVDGDERQRILLELERGRQACTPPFKHFECLVDPNGGFSQEIRQASLSVAAVNNVVRDLAQFHVGTQTGRRRKPAEDD